MAAKGTIIVTGANGGLGSAIVKQVASNPDILDHYGLYLVRNASTASALNSALAQGSSSHKHEAMSLDLTDLDEVRQVAKDINSRVSAGQMPPIRALILNAAFLDMVNQTWTSTGHDVTFASNYLGHWLLTLLLLQSLDKQAARIVVIGSQSHDTHDPRNARTKAFEEAKYKQLIGTDQGSVEAIATGTWSSVKEDPSFRSGFRRYGASKLCLVMMIHELQLRLNKDPNLKDVKVVGVDPGTMITSLQRLAPWVIRVFIFGVVYPVLLHLFRNDAVRTPQRSASDVLHAALGDGPPKALYLNGRQPMETNSEARDSGKRELVWKESIKYTQLMEGETILCHWQ